ncbi:hypothetical protein HDA32_003985 [Spinactinospora alkalitolerans]|uniref:DUF4126 domain-containing protein n=1 Tax=Spinactinospora alkalitolerans TaxID=687207 RepID=A0A852TZY0_9ACTN|nr:DUF4126 domain-containing protein [Spinactinospora alkalitolerans]NYE48865.1 hypothetical protein [Spinactinospora alkalitolerans]
MLEVLTGAGLASAAGLNAYVPLLAVGLIARYTDLLPLSGAWQWLENPVVLVVVGLLLAVELVADKVPAVDSVNDVLQTFVRPTSGGITFGAGASAVTVTDGLGAAAEADGGSWWPVAAGVLIALALHAVKALARPVLNVATGGVGAPVVSTAEDAASTVLALLAILVPLIVLAVLPLSAVFALWVWRARRRRRRRRAVERDAAA